MVHLLVSGVAITATEGKPQTCLTSPPLPPAPAAVNGSDLEGGHVGQKLSSRACRLRCLLSWLQGKAVVLPSPPRCWTTVPWARGSEAGWEVGCLRGGVPARGCPPQRADPAALLSSLRPRELGAAVPPGALAGRGGSDALT